MKTESIARINNVSIVIIDNVEELVPIKPICKALGIDSKSQYEKMQNDEILSLVKVLSISTGSDGKQHEMFCIPFKYVFGWFFFFFVISSKCYHLTEENGTTLPKI